MSAPEVVVWLNGSLRSPQEAVVPIMSHALHYGTTVFEGMRAHAGVDGVALFRASDHLDRLRRSAAAYGMDVPYSPDELRTALHSVVVASGLADAYLRPLVFRGAGSMSLDFSGTTVEVAIAAWRLDDYYGRGSRKMVSATVSRWRRISPTALVPRAKAAGHYLNSMLAKADAQQRGFDEAVLLDEHGLVCEGTAMNIFAVLSGRLVTPAATPYVLDGVTRRTVLRLAEDLGIETREGSVTVEELRDADEVLLTGTGARIVPVGKLDDRQFPAIGPVTEALHERFERAVRGHLPQYSNWLDVVVPTGALAAHLVGGTWTSA